MRCRKALRLLGPLLDGELKGEVAGIVRRHVEECASCARRFSELQSLVRELTALPEIVPTEDESIRLLRRLRLEMTAPSQPHPRHLRLRTAAVTACILAAVFTVVTWALVTGGRGKAPPEEINAARGTAIEETASGMTSGRGEAQTSAPYPQVAGELAVRPLLLLSQKEYSSNELESYREDLGTRMAFYSAYWYPLSGDVDSPLLPTLQEKLISDLLEQASRSGLNPEELRKAIETSLAQGGQNLLPCQAELSRLQGREVWLVSLSGPEDYLLFPDPQMPPALHLAAWGGSESLKLSDAFVKELAERLLPLGNRIAVSCSSGEYRGEGKEGSPETGQGKQGGEGMVPETAEEDFQAFIRELAAQGSSMDAVSALQKLNYEQILMLLQGEWAALASSGVNLSDFLVPPHRLWAVDRATGQILWGKTHSQ